MKDELIDPFGFDENDEDEVVEAQETREISAMETDINDDLAETMMSRVKSHIGVECEEGAGPCEICGAHLPDSYTLNAFFYTPGGDPESRGVMTLPYNCFVCGKRLCPDCAVKHGETNGVFLICSDECAKKMCVIDGFRNLLSLSVADDNMTEHYLGDYIAPFWWSMRCRK